MFYPNLGQENGDERDLENSYRSMLSPTALTVAHVWTSPVMQGKNNRTAKKQMQSCIRLTTSRSASVALMESAACKLLTYQPYGFLRAFEIISFITS